MITILHRGGVSHDPQKWLRNMCTTPYMDLSKLFYVFLVICQIIFQGTRTCRDDQRSEIYSQFNGPRTEQELPICSCPGQLSETAHNTHNFQTTWKVLELKILQIFVLYITNLWSLKEGISVRLFNNVCMYMYFGVIFYLKNQSVEKVITLFIIPGGKGLFLDLTILTAPISQQCFQCVSCWNLGQSWPEMLIQCNSCFWSR